MKTASAKAMLRNCRPRQPATQARPSANANAAAGSQGPGRSTAMTTATANSPQRLNHRAHGATSAAGSAIGSSGSIFGSSPVSAS